MFKLGTEIISSINRKPVKSRVPVFPEIFS
jgi:hypothetical protein